MARQKFEHWNSKVEVFSGLTFDFILKKYSFWEQEAFISFSCRLAIALPIPACPDATCHVSPVSNCFGEQLGTLHLK